ncbi:hypothetical protein V8E36_007832 [Tilletia maclaganii]
MPPTRKQAAGGSIVQKPNEGGAKVPWPPIGPKELGAPEWLIPDQVALFPHFLSASECGAIINLFAPSASGNSTSKTQAAKSKSSGGGATVTPSSTTNSNLALSPSPPAKRGEAVRTNYRASTIDPGFARTLYLAGLDKAVADWPSQDKPRKGCEPKRPAGLHANIRVYRYDPGAIFGPHYDQTSICPSTGLASEWTLLVYLSGPESGLVGGQTVFYDKHSVASAQKWEVEPRTGMALLHRHGAACMLHEALPPTAGTKWVLRSDLHFSR